MGVHFHRQVPLLEYIDDFYCHELQLAIEIDGVSHDFKYDKDQQREHQLEKVGVHLLRLQDQEVKSNMFSVLMSIKETIAQMQHKDPNLNAEKTPLKSPQGDNS